MGWMVQDLNPSKGKRFSVDIETGPGAYLASVQWVWHFFLKCPGHGINHPPTSSTEVEERVEQYLCSSTGSSWSVKG